MRGRRIAVPPLAWETASVLVRFLDDPGASTARVALGTVPDTPDGVADLMIALATKLCDQLAIDEGLPVFGVGWRALGIVMLPGTSSVALADLVVSYTWSGDREPIVTAVSQCMGQRDRQLAAIMLMALAVRSSR